jgi:serine/threonine protein kinase
LQKEVNIMRTAKHDGIVQILDVVTTPKILFIIMEYCAKGELFAYIISRDILPFSEIKQMFSELANALNFLHENNIVHRDLKPENMLLTAEGRLKLCDFGLSAMAEKNDLLDTPCGSTYYAAPEVIKGEKYDGRKSDMWSLGVVLFAMATKCLPWTATNDKELYHQITKAEFHIPSGVHRDIAEVISMLLKADPAERASASQLLDTVLVKSKPVCEEPKKEIPRSSRSPRRIRRMDHKVHKRFSRGLSSRTRRVIRPYASLSPSRFPKA